MFRADSRYLLGAQPAADLIWCLLHCLEGKKDAQLSVWGWAGLVGSQCRTDITKGHLYGICFQPVHMG